MKFKSFPQLVRNSRRFKFIADSTTETQRSRRGPQRKPSLLCGPLGLLCVSAVKKRLALPLCLLFSTFTAFAQPAVHQSQTPKLVIAEPEVNLGEVRQGTAAKHSFVVKNDGTTDLEIKRVSPACGCTASEFTSVISPGKTGNIALSINTTTFNGPIAKTAEVYTNDPGNERITLTMKLVVITNQTPDGFKAGSFLVGPTNGWVGRAPLGMTTGGLLTVTNLSAQPFKLRIGDAGGTAFRADLKTLEEGKRYSLNFSSSSALPVGVHRQIVRLLTDDPQTPTIEATLEVRVVPAVDASPARLIFEKISLAELGEAAPTINKFIFVRAARGSGLEVRSATCDLPYITLKVDRTEADGRSVILRVGFAAKPPKGVQVGRIRIVTNNPDRKEIETEIEVRVLE
jgi:hypothetical protein